MRLAAQSLLEQAAKMKSDVPFFRSRVMTRHLTSGLLGRNRRRGVRCGLAGLVKLADGGKGF